MLPRGNAREPDGPMNGAMWRNRDGRDRRDWERSGQRRWSVKAAPSTRRVGGRLLGGEAGHAPPRGGPSTMAAPSTDRRARRRRCGPRNAAREKAAAKPDVASPMRASRLTTSGDAINVGIGEKRPGTQVQVGVGSGGIAVTADPAHPVTPRAGARRGTGQGRSTDEYSGTSRLDHACGGRRQTDRSSRSSRCSSAYSASHWPALR